jgi:putative transcriptional regulator
MNSPEWHKVETDRNNGDELHYKSCGLDNIYLVGGFTRHRTNYGDGVSIVNVEGLHRAIADSLISSEESLTGQEIRFLRKEMKLTQEGLACFVKVGAQQVARWEKDETPIPGSADILIRALYKQHVGNHANLKKMAEGLHEGSKRNSAHPRMVFQAAA